MAIVTNRTSDHPVSEHVLNRWAPRSFTNEEIPDATLMSMFEAARWAPSASNVQPWRFVYCKRGRPSFEAFVAALNAGNQVWARHAAVLIAIISKTTLERDGEQRPSPTHAFDTGAAWMSLAVQATRLGWHTHGMAGFDRDKLAAALDVPAGYHINAVAAIGKLGPREALPEALQAREVPSQRKPLKEIVSADRFTIP
jgi:nitroreductase